MKAPPYALLLGSDKGVWVFGGPRAWQRAQRKPRHAVVLPHKSIPDNYDWTCMRGREVVLCWDGANEDQVIRFGRLLVLAGATLVVGLGDRLQESIFFRGRRRGALHPNTCR